ncbi:hypothetical protein WICPIJ_007169 [Wickerhamomyces pijperi]|uniref:Vacuolar protein sorting-associated protein 20 n=1 Tax=Wickerhamomyces pijperi TaxID=599730 RepID=A0A9P8Q0Q3_WICPI|nr:hypothetical protein WICPIJ_007169 [Wickerhamomyces pijperi]
MGNTTSSSSPRINSQDKAIFQLKLQKDKLKQYERRTTQLINSETLQVKLLLREGRKDAAKTLLKRSKYQATLLENVNNQILNLDNLIHNIEFKIIEKEFLKGLSQGNETLAKLNRELNVNDVTKLIDEVNENIEYQNEIDELLSNSIVGKDYEDEIDEELQALEREYQVKNLPEAVSGEINDSVAVTPEKVTDDTQNKQKQKQENTPQPMLA